MNMNDIFRRILNEGFYKGVDFEKHGFKYLNKVLNDFETKDTISVKDVRNNAGDKDITYLKSDKYKNHINRFRNWINGDKVLSDNVGTSKEYLERLQQSNDIRNTVLNDFFQSFDIKWTNIEKSDPAIIKTSEQESIQALFLAARIKGDNCFSNIHALYDSIGLEEQIYEDLIKPFYVNDLGIRLANTKIDFSNESNKKVLKKLANILNMEIPSEFSKLDNFTIIHPDGLINDIDVEFAKVLFGNGIKWEKKFMGQTYTDTISKDAFIPADIYIIPLNRIGELKTRIQKEGGKFSPDSMVTLSNDLFNNKDGDEPLIYPISLKMSLKPTFHKIENSKKKNIIQVGIEDIDSINFNQTGNSTVEIKCGNDTLVFEFRTKNTGAKWQCNAMNKFNKDAIEGGSAKDYMKIIFKDSMNGHITKDDVDKIVEVFGNKIKIDEKLELSESSTKNKSTVLEESFKRFFEDESDVEVDVYVKNRSSTLAESFIKFFEDEEENTSASKITANDMVSLAIPGTAAYNNITSSSAKEGNIGLGLFCKKLIDNNIEKSGHNNESLSKIVQLSYKLSEYVQDTWKIM